MAGHLLILFIILLAPTLTVEPELIIDSDRVHLKCHTIFKDSQCYFSFDYSQYKTFPCQHTLSGQKLRSLVNKRSPADVTVTCLYVTKSGSSRQSNKIIVHIRDLARPSLSVEPSVITETDSVTLHCQPPAFASQSLCSFILNGVIQSSSPCVQTVRGSDLLKDQSPPAQVKVQCFYTINGKWTNSPHSSEQTVTIQSPKPEVSVEVHNDLVGIFCSLLGSANSQTMCHLYYGESLRPFLTKNAEVKMTDSRRLCYISTSLDALWRDLTTLKSKEISCDDRLENGDKSPRSDGYDMSAFIKNTPVPQPHVTTAVLEPVKTTTPGHVTGSEPKTSSPGLPSSRTLVWDVLILLLHTVIALSLLLALSFCCTRILSDTNSEDPNNEALALKKMVDDKYVKEKAKAKMEVAKVSAVSLTADMWTSINTDAYLAITGHYINGEDKLDTVLLGVEHFQESHTADNLAEAMTKQMEEWHIKSKVKCIVTDAASNIIACAKNVQIRCSSCIAHRLNLLVRKSFEDITALNEIRLKA
ncbi:uncharacterized protein LOC117382091 [Periophthalmus magnuspinnatus]|uniref:uncharacterized protein LOC117382091 n=1 Tax=Periophthalmus magnuspinnatus TaxID=409849 RepID=UPI0024367E9F|nr:uncharacterized protein LOC117382091 [Periophthalmus magnuspinnatus]